MTKAIILAAGRGSRMDTLTDDKPKALVCVHGKPLIDHQITALKDGGVKEIIIITGYKSECLKPWGDKHIHNSEWESSNMLYSLLCASEYLKKEDFIVAYSDIFYHSSIIKDLIRSEALVSVAYDFNWLSLWSKRFSDPLEDAETFDMNDNNWLLEIGNKTDDISKIKGQYMGLLKFKKEFWETPLHQIEKNLQLTSFLSNLLKQKFPIKAVKNTEPFGEADSASDLKVLNEIVLASSVYK